MVKYISPVNILFFSKTSSRRLQHMPSRRLQRNVLRDVLKTSSRRLQDVFKTSWKTKNCYAEDLLKTSWRHVLKTSWTRFEDVLQTNKCLLGCLSTAQSFIIVPKPDRNYWFPKEDFFFFSSLGTKKGEVDTVITLTVSIFCTGIRQTVELVR